MILKFVSATVFAKEAGNMLKMGFVIGIPSIITYLASTYSQSLENILYIFMLSAAALLVGILSQIGAKSRSREFSASAKPCDGLLPMSPIKRGVTNRE